MGGIYEIHPNTETSIRRGRTLRRQGQRSRRRQSNVSGWLPEGKFQVTPVRSLIGLHPATLVWIWTISSWEFTEAFPQG